MSKRINMEFADGLLHSVPLESTVISFFKTDGGERACNISYAAPTVNPVGVTVERPPIVEGGEPQRTQIPVGLSSHLPQVYFTIDVEDGELLMEFIENDEVVFAIDMKKYQATNQVEQGQIALPESKIS